MSGHGTKTLVPFVVTLLIGFLGAHDKCLSNELVEVRIGTDHKRVVVRAQEAIKDYSSFALHRPSRLVIDIPGCSSGDIHRVDPPGKHGSLAVRVSGTRSGARLVLDFKRGAVPAHRVRLLDNCLIVFLGEWSVPAGASSSRYLPNREESPLKRSRTSRKASNPAGRFRNHVGRQSGDLSIKSAEVVDGLIVLQVAESNSPERIYRIELGVNLASLGFDSAGIRPDSFRAEATGVRGSTDRAAEASDGAGYGEVPRVVGLATGQWDLIGNAN